MPRLSISKVFKDSFNVYHKDFFKWIGLFFTTIYFTFLSVLLIGVLLTSLQDHPYLGVGLLFLFLFLIGPIIFFMLSKIAFNWVAGSKSQNTASIKILKTFDLELYIKFLIIIFLLSFIVNFGAATIIFWIPAIYIRIRLSLSVWVLFDEPKKYISEIFKTSWDLTNGITGKLFLIKILAFGLLILILGLSLGLSVFYILPWYLIFNVYLYTYIKQIKTKK